jgi:hypothetical protein
MYALVKDNAVVKYPYTFTDCIRDNPKTSFPKSPSESVFAEFGVLPVREVAQPSVDHTKNIVWGTPVFNNGWEQVWVVEDATAEQIAERTSSQASSVRSERNRLLEASDWTQLADSSADKSSWASYRQQLRDITKQAGFPFSVTWPVAP